MSHWLWVHLGLAGTGSWYAWWSGSGSDLGEIAIIGGLITLVRKHNCHIQGCWRLQRSPVDGTPYIVCHKHHPLHDGEEITLEKVHRLHKGA